MKYAGLRDFLAQLERRGELKRVHAEADPRLEMTMICDRVLKVDGQAQGKMRVAYNKGEAVAPGTLIDEHGRPTTNPGVVVVLQSNGLLGALLTFGEYEGYGIAVACELLGGALSGGGTWRWDNDPATRAVVNGMLTILIDPARLGTQADFDREAVAFVDWLRAGPVAPGFESVLLAGDPERAARAHREVHGIDIDDQTWAELVAAVAKVDVVIAAQ